MFIDSLTKVTKLRLLKELVSITLSKKNIFVNLFMKKYKTLITICLIVVSFFYHLWQLDHDNNLLPQIIFFAVGQGDSALIITKSKQYILIDGGPDQIILSKIGMYLPSNKPQIDLIIISHAHADHIVGLIEIIQRYPVKKIIYPGPINYQDPSYLTLLNLIKNKNIELLTTAANDRYIFTDQSYWLTWYPDIAFVSQKVKDVNETSVVGQYCYIRSCILFMADAPQKIEKALLNQKKVLVSQLIKIGHHGSYYSSNEQFLKAVSPIEAIISVGKNKFGHPNPGVLKMLKRLKINIWRTDQNGDITVFLNGKTVEINNNSRYNKED